MIMLRIAAVLPFLLSACEAPDPTTAPNPTGNYLNQQMGSAPAPGFARADAPRVFTFPRDHGAQPEFSTEWWYFTGNLYDGEERRFGYQLTLFRIGLEAGRPAEDSSWRANQIYMGHFAISDVASAQHFASERFSRAAAGLAGANNPPLEVWLGPWSIRAGGTGLFPLQLTAATADMEIALTLQAGDRARVLQGEDGLSRKSADPGNASYYYSYTRLPTLGTLRIGRQHFRVTGNSWFDREWSSSALAPDQAGWDWFALQLEDGHDLMYYRMRDLQGRAQAFSSGTLLLPDGSKKSLSPESVELTPVRYWRSDRGTRYPVAWRMAVPDHGMDLLIEAAFDDQHMPLTVEYWEGAVDVSGNRQGVGYLELSGYSR
jgi:predicted secreted hydrolase